MLWCRGDGQDARKQLWRSKIGVSAGMIGGVVNGQLRRGVVFLIIADFLVLETAGESGEFMPNIA